MWRVLKTIGALVLGIGGWLGILYIPADIVGLPDTYPFLKRVADVSREALLVWFSGLLVAYLTYVELRPWYRAWRLKRTWIDYPAAAQMIYERYRSESMVRGLIASSHYVRPVEDVMSSWLEDGIQQGTVLARGRREYSGTFEDVPTNIAIKSDDLPGGSSGGFDCTHFAESHDGHGTWHDLHFSGGSVQRYLKALEADTERRAKAPSTNSFAIEEEATLRQLQQDTVTRTQR